jgi:hypothetical protein
VAAVGVEEQAYRADSVDLTVDVIAHLQRDRSCPAPAAPDGLCANGGAVRLVTKLSAGQRAGGLIVAKAIASSAARKARMQSRRVADVRAGLRATVEHVHP